MLENPNPMVLGQESFEAPIGRCDGCHDAVYQGYSGVTFEDEIFCCTSCLVDHLVKKGAIEEI